MTIALIALVAVGILYFIVSSKGGSGSPVKSVSPMEAKQLLSDKSVIALDVRTPAEVKAGKIKGAKALNVTSMNFAKGLEELDKSKKYVVYCRSGKRSLKACQIMASKGFEDVVNMNGGYMAWK